jgi:hypothetical protein
MSKFFLVYDRNNDPIAVVRAEEANGLQDTIDHVATNDFNVETYLSIGEEVRVLGEAYFHEFATEYMAKLGEAYYDSHYQSAAQLAGESTL